jgi:hypothetical protein
MNFYSQLEVEIAVVSTGHLDLIRLHLAADGTWTHDLVLTKDALYQLSYSSDKQSTVNCSAKHKRNGDSTLRTRPLQKPTVALTKSAQSHQLGKKAQNICALNVNSVIYNIDSQGANIKMEK